MNGPLNGAAGHVADVAALAHKRDKVKEMCAGWVSFLAANNLTAAIFSMYPEPATNDFTISSGLLIQELDALGFIIVSHSASHLQTIAGPGGKPIPLMLVNVFIRAKDENKPRIFLA